MTDEQVMALMQMQDIPTEEQALRRQSALSDQLRGSALRPSAGKDWASQLSRGIQGGMAGYSMGQERDTAKALGTARKSNLQTALGMMRKPPQPGMAPDYREADYTNVSPEITSGY